MEITAGCEPVYRLVVHAVANSKEARLWVVLFHEKLPPIQHLLHFCNRTNFSTVPVSCRYPFSTLRQRPASRNYPGLIPVALHTRIVACNRRSQMDRKFDLQNHQLQLGLQRIRRNDKTVQYQFHHLGNIVAVSKRHSHFDQHQKSTGAWPPPKCCEIAGSCSTEWVY